MSREQEEVTDMGEVYDEGYKAGLARGMRLGSAQADIDSAEAAIDDQSWRLDDPTGQDADDPAMDEMYKNLIQARDKKLLVEDPDAYAERKYFEACSRYLP